MSTKEQLIQGLNNDLAAEWSTIMRYTSQASKAFGIMGTELREIFANEIQDELRHATYLSDVIVDLGGEPTVTPKPFANANDVKEMLELDLKAEEQDVQNYMNHAKLAEDAGEVELKLKLEEMAAEEDGHAREIRRLLKGM